MGVESAGASGPSIRSDVHRDFCQVAIADGGRAGSAGRIAMMPEQLELFTRSLAPTDRAVLEATGNALAIAGILEPHVAEVVLAHAKPVRAMSHARVKTDQALSIEGRSPFVGSLRQLDFLTGELAQVDAIIAEHALGGSGRAVTRTHTPSLPRGRTRQALWLSSVLCSTSRSAMPSPWRLPTATARSTSSVIRLPTPRGMGSR
jgi:hypothetical protein